MDDPAITKCLAQVRDLHLQVVLFNRDARPHGAHKRVVAYRLAGSIEKGHEYIEGAATETHRHSIAEQAGLTAIHFERTERDLRQALRRHVSLSRSLG